MSGDSTSIWRYAVEYKPVQLYSASSIYAATGNTSGLAVVTDGMTANSMYDSDAGGYVSDPLQALLQRIIDMELGLQNARTAASAADARIAQVEQLAKESIAQAHRERDEMYALVEDLKELNG